MATLKRTQTSNSTVISGDRITLKEHQDNPKTHVVDDDPSNWEKMGRKYRLATRKSAMNWVQNPIGIAGGVVSDAITKVFSGEYLEGTPAEGLDINNLVGGVGMSKIWRLMLLFPRHPEMEQGISPRPSVVEALLPSIDLDKGDSENKHTTKTLSTAEVNSPDAIKIHVRRRHEDDLGDSEELLAINRRNYTEEKFKALESTPKARQNDIIIFNLSVSPYQSITLQNRPDELRVDPKSSWATVASMGRNNPFYLYTGGEDTISFDISWFVNDPARRDEVVAKCRLLESWTKADGYNAAPPILLIKWGGSGIFDNDNFILESAPYTLTHFQDRTRSKADEYYKGQIQDLKLYPNCAKQTLTFKKVTSSNITHAQIVDPAVLKGIQGINLSANL